MEKQPKMVVVEDNIIFKTITRNSADLIRENTHQVQGPEGMTEREKVKYLKDKFTSPYDNARNLRRR